MPTVAHVRLTLTGALLTVPCLAVFLALFLVPLSLTVDQSFRLYVPGRIGAAEDAPYTIANYVELFDPAYIGYFFHTFRIGFIASAIALAVSFPIAYQVARQRSRRLRNVAVAFLVTMMFLSALVRVYSIELTFGHAGLTPVISELLNISPNSRTLTEILVIAGLLHYVIPMSILTLIGPVQNVNPALTEAAQSLGAPRWKAHVLITVPLSSRGLVAAFLISYTLCISAFVIPLVLGKGRVLFISNLVYSRFSEVANYPSGAAIAIAMLLASLVVFVVFSRLAAARWLPES